VDSSWLKQQAKALDPSNGDSGERLPRFLIVRPQPINVDVLIRTQEVIARVLKMPVLEVTQLRLKGILVADPALLENLSAVRNKLQTNSSFYSCVEDPTLVYVLGIWNSLAAHMEFLASPARDEVLGPQTDILGFEWTIHQELDAMTSLPLDAPILAIERLLVKEHCVDAFDQAVSKHASLLQDSHLAKITHGWRCDPPASSHEAVILSGWKDQNYISFSAGQHKHGSNASIEGEFEEILVHHAWNLEHVVAAV
jgi:hypothetical protein